MTDLARPVLGAIDALPPGAVPGPTVRALVTWTEGEIDLLRRQLEDAEREAAEAEREADRLSRPLLGTPSLSVSTALQTPTPLQVPVQTPSPAGIGPVIDTGIAAVGVPPGPTIPDPKGVAAHRPSPSAQAPRTTVVVRPRAVGTATPARGIEPAWLPVTATGASTANTTPSGGQDARPYRPARASSHRRTPSGWFRTHLMMKAGVALVLVGLLLVKFG